MPFTLTMPKLSPTMEEGTIAKWHKKEGDRVEPGDLIMEVSTDKATVEHNAIDEGYVRKILVPEGNEAIVNQAIAVMSEEADESIEDYKPEGAVKEQEKKEEEPPPKKTPAFTIAPPQPVSAPPPITSKQGTRLLVSPLARKLAKERGLNLSGIKGTGPGGRIMSRDLEGAAPAASFSFHKKELPSIPSGTYEEITLTPVRKIIAQRLLEAKSSIPHFYVTMAVDANPLHEVREQLKANEVKLTFNDFIMKAAALALRKHPKVNSGYNPENDTIIQFKTIDISVAVSVEEGLITPIVRYADYKSLGEISEEVRFLSKKAKEGKLQPQEFQGGSFTVSNLGMYGVFEFAAIINPPQSAILAVGGIQDAPVIRGGEVVPGKVMNLTLSADHRVVDGVAAAEFLKTLQDLLEKPAVLLL